MIHHSFNINTDVAAHRVSFTFPEQATLNEVIEGFEQFLKAVGYVLPNGAHLGYEYEESDENDIVRVY